MREGGKREGGREGRRERGEEGLKFNDVYKTNMDTYLVQLHIQRGGCSMRMNTSCSCSWSSRNTSGFSYSSAPLSSSSIPDVWRCEDWEIGEGGGGTEGRRNG